MVDVFLVFPVERTVQTPSHLTPHTASPSHRARPGPSCGEAVIVQRRSVKHPCSDVHPAVYSSRVCELVGRRNREPSVSVGGWAVCLFLGISGPSLRVQWTHYSEAGVKSSEHRDSAL